MRATFISVLSAKATVRNPRTRIGHNLQQASPRDTPPVAREELLPSAAEQARAKMVHEPGERRFVAYESNVRRRERCEIDWLHIYKEVALE